MRKDESCTVCGCIESTEINVYSEILRLPPKYSIRKCDSCSLIRLSPIPNQDESNEHYKSSEYYSADEYRTRAETKIPVFMARLNFIA